MDSLKIDNDIENLKITCDANKGLIELKGVSINEDPLKEIYQPIFGWLEEYRENYKPETIVNFQLEYFNTSSSKCILNIFEMLKLMQDENSDANVAINWHYNEKDLDMLEAGEDYQDMVELPFNYIKTKK